MRARLAMAPLVFGLALSACRKDERASAGAAAGSASAVASTSSSPSSSESVTEQPAASASTSSAPTSPLPPRPTEPPVLGAESYLAGTKALDAIVDLRARNGGALDLLDLHVYPGRIVLKARDPRSDAINRWEIRASGVIGPKPEGLSAKKLEKRLFGDAAVPLARLSTMCAEAVAKTGLADGLVTLVDVRRGKISGVTMRFAVHANGTTRWADVEVPK